MNEQDETRAWVRAVFHDGEDAPRDLATAGATYAELRAWYLDQNARFADTKMIAARYMRPGEVLLDLDGVPSHVGPSEECWTWTLPPVVTPGLLSRLGLTKQDVPNLNVLETEGES